LSRWHLLIFIAVAACVAVAHDFWPRGETSTGAAKIREHPGWEALSACSSLDSLDGHEHLELFADHRAQYLDRALLKTVPAKGEDLNVWRAGGGTCGNACPGPHIRPVKRKGYLARLPRIGFFSVEDPASPASSEQCLYRACDVGLAACGDVALRGKGSRYLPQRHALTVQFFRQRHYLGPSLSI
jgi:hypothetical protein